MWKDLFNKNENNQKGGIYLIKLLHILIRSKLDVKGT